MYAHAQAPVRIGLAGGGTDLPVWTREHVGRCLSLAVSSYAHAVAITRPDGQVVASYRQLDSASSATEIANGLIRESALLHDWEVGFEVHTLSEISSRGSGLGVSSSIAVALAACFQRMADLRAGHPGGEVRWRDGGEGAFRAGVARDAWRVEIDRLRRPVGRQDHMAAAYGGLRLYSFSGDSAEIERTFSADDAAWVAKHLLLVALPDGHDARAILARVTNCEMLSAALGAVPVALQAIEQRNAGLLGQALIMGQKSKYAIPGASPPWLERILETISECYGVLGCKVAGAGGGGHVVVVTDGNNAAQEISAATNLSVTSVAPDLAGVRSDACR